MPPFGMYAWAYVQRLLPTGADHYDNHDNHDHHNHHNHHNHHDGFVS